MVTPARVPQAINDARPRTLAGAAVLLRRALAALDAHNCKSPWREPERVEGRLVAAALGVVDRCLASLAPESRLQARGTGAGLAQAHGSRCDAVWAAERAVDCVIAATSFEDDAEGSED